MMLNSDSGNASRSLLLRIEKERKKENRGAGAASFQLRFTSAMTGTL